MHGRNYSSLQLSIIKIYLNFCNFLQCKCLRMSQSGKVFAKQTSAASLDGLEIIQWDRERPELRSCVYISYLVLDWSHLDHKVLRSGYIYFRGKLFIAGRCTAVVSSYLPSYKVFPDIATIWNSIMKPMWCTFHSVYWESRSSTYFEHYLLILRRRYTTALGILRAYNVSWLCHDCSDIIRTQYTKCRLCSTFWVWASNARNM
jgi:hypothetical protein